ncbi:MAG TPA: fibronectin type III domain-containing protein, partial [Saprospiraceae bacterium]|nr:fibronectin type III domain-containing protein [Saprospiraceae bacterium]
GQYYLEVEDEQNQPSNFHLEVQVSDTFYQLNGIQPGVLYKFKVSTHCDSSSHGPWSNWQFFNGNSDSTSTGGNGGGGGGSCGKPAGLHVTGISSAAANLHWFAVPGAVSYTLEIERYQNSTSNPWQITQVVNTNSFHLTGLNANTRYKFKVRANCAGGHGDWSNWRKFKTALGVLSPAFFNPGSALEERAGSPTTPAPAFDSQIWPNPVKTTATIRLAHLKSETVSLRVMDLSGRTVLDRQFQPENAELEETISFQELPEGCYLVRVQNGADVKSTKLVVIR